MCQSSKCAKKDVWTSVKVKNQLVISSSVVPQSAGFSIFACLSQKEFVDMSDMSAIKLYLSDEYVRCLWHNLPVSLFLFISFCADFFFGSLAFVGLLFVLSLYLSVCLSVSLSVCMSVNCVSRTVLDPCVGPMCLRLLLGLPSSSQVVLGLSLGRTVRCE